MSGYLLDSNFWINAGNYYPPDLFPSFWSSMESLIKSGDVIIHQTVQEEIDRREDFVSSWLHGIDGYKAMPVSEAALEKYLECCKWVENPMQRYTEGAISEFEQNSRADAWICAEAAASDLTVVSAEKQSNTQNKVKIPNVCIAFDIKFLSNFDFMRSQKFSF